MAIRFPRITAAKRQKALAEAEKEFARARPKQGKSKHVSLRTSRIKERLELFQPREFSYGTRTVDPDWVNELARRIGIHGELDPVLVIRIDKEWVCVDGHHRIAAYRTRNHRKPIKCELFSGTPTEAVEESMRRNKKNTLPIPNADRMEEAWRRVLLSQGSKDEIAKACNIGTGTVANMRRAKRRYEADPEFAERVGRPLLETSWGIMKLAACNADEKEVDLQDRAEMLARNIRRRMSNLLSLDPLVTAHALAKYDAQLPRSLMDVWSGRMAIPAPRNLTEPEMRKQIGVLWDRMAAVTDALQAHAEGHQEALRAAELRDQRERERLKKLWSRPAKPAVFHATDADDDAPDDL
jgi:hypothetical protein